MNQAACFSELNKSKQQGYEVVKLGHPALRNPSAKIPSEMFHSRELDRFVENMRYTLEKEGGVGLAAPQVGVNLELLVTRVSEGAAGRYLLCEKSDFKVWINPRIAIVDSAQLLGAEGCLSVPGYVGLVARPKEIQVHAVDENGQGFSERLSGWNARVFLHEQDHLKGIMYMDKLEGGSGVLVGFFHQEIWKTMEEERRKANDYSWLEKHSLKCEQ